MATATLEFDETAERLFTHATQHAHRLGYRFGDGAEQDIRGLCQKAASELGRNVIGIAGIRSAGGEVKLRQSEVALEVFVEEMVKAAQAQPGYLATNSNVIGEQTFAVALRSLCPIWPICP
ncbi:MAG: hypothetical protein AAFO80_02410 [Pseudomonadota bacterium]